MRNSPSILLLAVFVSSFGLAQTTESNEPILVKDPGLQILGQVGGSVGDNEQPKEINALSDNVRESYRVFVDFGLMNRVRAQLGASYAGMAGRHYSTGLTPIDGRLLYFPYYSSGFSPYLFAGVGALRYEIFQSGPGRMSPGVATDGWVAHVPVGAGFVTQFSQRVGLDLTMGWHCILSDNANGRLGSSNDSYWSALIGLRVAIGKTACKRQQEELEKQKAEQERLRKEAELRAAEERRRKELEAQKEAEELKRKQEQAQKELEARKAEEAKKAQEAVKPVAPPPAPMPVPPKPVAPELKFEPVYFFTGGAVLTAKEKVKLDAAAKVLMENPGVKIAVSGHTDNVGSRAINEKLSTLRANAVRKYLVGKGVGEARISHVAKAFDEPAASNEDVEGRQLNRRVELRVVK